ncbi:ABC transporter ATP-binding protein [Haliangium ochraceum]|uniref:ABC transporter related protein n=1 Tax=Haliangium ochraceum (strain DSM 14365 / JCM 11303 / SMP-2) TaxID=502025 RepID=D0LXA6_HALO1|nr:ABC transporter ATP-binding protein [Haliangium ochraceum]ACY16148.1 ABC transporter related protein [Haliangium ochraceum DSM 14365]
MLQITGLSKRLGGRPVIDELSVRCAAGRVCVIAGSNGSGKSTLLRMVAGVMEPDRGDIEIAGVDLGASPVAARRRLGYVPEAANPPGYMSGDELFALVSALKGAPLPSAEEREALDVTHLAGERISRLSLGQRRRVCLAAALIGAPALLVLDEPSNGLDRASVEALAAQLRTRRDQGVLVLVATHDQGFSDAIADERYQLSDGRLRPAENEA